MDSTVCVTVEISDKSWVVGMRSPAGPERTSLHKLKAGDVASLVGKIEHGRHLAARKLGAAPSVLLTCEPVTRVSG